MEKDMGIISIKIKTRKLESFVVLSDKKRKSKLLKNKSNFENYEKLRYFIIYLFCTVL